MQTQEAQPGSALWAMPEWCGVDREHVTGGCIGRTLAKGQRYHHTGPHVGALAVMWVVKRERIGKQHFEQA